MLIPNPIDFPNGTQATWAFPIVATCDFARGKVEVQVGFYLNQAAQEAGKEPMKTDAYSFDLAGAEAVLGAPLNLSGPVLALLAAALNNHS